MSQIENNCMLRDCGGTAIPALRPSVSTRTSRSPVSRTISKLRLKRRGFLDQDQLMFALGEGDPKTLGERYGAIARLSLVSPGFLDVDEFLAVMQTDEPSRNT